MRPTNRQNVLLLILLIIFIVIVLFITRGVKDPTVETMGLRATNFNEDVSTKDYEAMGVSTTTTLPPTTTTTTTTLPPTTTTTWTPPQTTEAAPPVVHQSSGVDWYAVAMCESSLGTGAPQWGINTGNGYYGGLQFSHSTWIAYGGGVYAENAHLTSAENQIAVASGMSLSHWPICGKHG